MNIYNIVACRPVVWVTTAREANIQEPLMSNGFANKHVHTETIIYNNDKCFLCGPCRDVTRGTSLELQFVSQ
jgi:NAD-dependent dihydropyrimidine dehydrogenase PreA subunit